MVDELDAVPGGEHVDEDTRGGGGAITEVGIRKSLVSGVSAVEDVAGCISQCSKGAVSQCGLLAIRDDIETHTSRRYRITAN
jgi:hypothetical protein